MKRRIITQRQIYNFERYMINNESSPLTVQKYLRDIRHFLTFLLNQELNKTLVIRYKNHLGSYFAITSANSMIASINSLFRFLGWPDLCTSQFRVQRQIFCSEAKALTKAEYFQLVHAAKQKGNEQLALIMQTICGCGLRVSELQYITVEALQKGEVTVLGKGKLRTVFIVPKLQKKLLKYAKKQQRTSGSVFVTRNGNPVNRSNIWRSMKRLCEGTGISPEKVFPHNLRHLFAQSFYELEKDIIKLADILGHSNINTTRIYTVTTGIEHKRRMERMRLII